MLIVPLSGLSVNMHRKVCRIHRVEGCKKAPFRGVFRRFYLNCCKNVAFFHTLRRKTPKRGDFLQTDNLTGKAPGNRYTPEAGRGVIGCRGTPALVKPLTPRTARVCEWNERSGWWEVPETVTSCVQHEAPRHPGIDL